VANSSPWQRIYEHGSRRYENARDGRPDHYRPRVPRAARARHDAVRFSGRIPPVYGGTIAPARLARSADGHVLTSSPSEARRQHSCGLMPVQHASCATAAPKALCGEMWTFYVRVQYQGKDVTMPLPLQVRWAGDTPVITLTEQSLPGMGAYTARVLIYQGRYAGTFAWEERWGYGIRWHHEAAGYAEVARPRAIQQLTRGTPYGRAPA
jgi:hypothetical protein